MERHLDQALDLTPEDSRDLRLSPALAAPTATPGGTLTQVERPCRDYYAAVPSPVAASCSPRRGGGRTTAGNDHIEHEPPIHREIRQTLAQGPGSFQPRQVLFGAPPN
ncbi:hypothetical protein ACPESR_14400 [Nocardia testacea]|uniref:hypothetical protein n=1 Tax=Nocardia testacea TaxID=248551 RepID=UPI003C2B76CD